MSEFVVDTCVLAISQDPHDERALDALALLHQIKVSHRVAIDHNKRILAEYFRNAPANSHAGQWLKTILSRADKVSFYPAQLSRHHRQGLEELSFDRSDIPFVATCADSVDGLLVSEDSDYTEEVRRYLKEELAIDVNDISSGLLKARA